MVGFSSNPLFYLAPRPGLEPGTCGLTVVIASLYWRGFRGSYQLIQMVIYTLCFVTIPHFTGYSAANLQQKIKRNSGSGSYT